MGGLIFILPILAFDVWVSLTTGRRQWQEIRAQRNWRKAAAMVGAGILLAALFAFFIEFKNGTTLRLKGFPVPFEFSQLQDGHWVVTTSTPGLAWLERVTDIVTGLVAPVVPFKVAEFLRTVKEEIK
ncbi:MAG TPA: hypothetical protein VHB20_07640 [Verrucomicrobiae bacterium]|jgi:hypothetical protein|nr:hypothetical protein [Verrucomicrobiae bacterium]